MPQDPYGPQKATVEFDPKKAHKGTCAACGLSKTVYAAKVYPEGRPWQAVDLCSDCIARVRTEAVWPLPAKG